MGLSLPSVVVLLQDGSNQDRHGGLSLRGGASSVGSIAPSFVEKHPPYPPLTGGYKKAMRTRRAERILLFLAPLTRGG